MSILTVEHLTHGFGDRAIFSDVSFRLLRGEHIGLVGANGEGKSTFFNIVTGHLTPDEGKIEWAKNVRIGYLDQHTVLEKGMTIRDVLKSAFAWLFELEQKMNDICDLLGSASEDDFLFGKCHLKLLFIFRYIERPASMAFHHHFYGRPAASFAPGARRYVIGNGLYIGYRIRRADSDTACLHYRDIREIIPEIHHLMGQERMSGTEVVEVGYLVSGSQIHVFRLHSAGNEPFADAFRTASRNDGDMISVH